MPMFFLLFSFDIFSVQTTARCVQYMDSLSLSQVEATGKMTRTKQTLKSVCWRFLLLCSFTHVIYFICCIMFFLFKKKQVKTCAFMILEAPELIVALVLPSFASSPINRNLDFHQFQQHSNFQHSTKFHNLIIFLNQTYFCFHLSFSCIASKLIIFSSTSVSRRFAPWWLLKQSLFRNLRQKVAECWQFRAILNNSNSTD